MTRLKAITLSAAVALGAALFAYSPAFAGTGAKFLTATGSVKVSMAEGEEFGPATKDLELPVGATIKTGQIATATFSVPNGVVKIKPRSMIMIAALPGDDPHASTVIFVKFGGVLLDTNDKAPGGSRIEVHSAGTTTKDMPGSPPAPVDTDSNKDKKESDKAIEKETGKTKETDKGESLEEAGACHGGANGDTAEQAAETAIDDVSVQKPSNDAAQEQNK